MTATELLSKLRADGVTIKVDGPDLVFNGKKSVLTSDVMVSVGELKPKIIQLISNPVGVCQCIPPMPMAVIASKPCIYCGIACWCTACGGCRWCSFEEKWADRLVVKRSKR
jgi:hypothetical protein